MADILTIVRSPKIEWHPLPNWWRAIYPCLVITTAPDLVRPVHNIIGIYPDGRVEPIAWITSLDAAVENARSLSKHLPGSLYVSGAAA